MKGFKIDWLEGTIKHRLYQDVLDMLKRLFLDDYVEIDYGGLGYSHSALVCETGRVYWSPDRPEMGVHLSMPSKALEIFGVNPLTLASDLQLEGMEFTRVDFALDDTVGLLNLDQILSAVESGAYVARSRQWEYRKNSKGGQTITFGSRSSDSYIRIYDKAVEQAGKTGVLSHWIRVELELKHERAQAAITALLAMNDPNEMVKVVFGWFRAALDFKTIGEDSNKSRWDTAEWWDEFLAFCEKVRIFISQKTRTAEEVVEWLEKQLAPCMLVAMSVFGSEGLLKLASDAVARLKPKHIAMMQGREA